MTDISSVVPVIGMGGSNGAGIGITPLDDGINPLAGPGTDFKAVAIGVGPNLEALPAYFDDPLLQTGNLPGLAMSAFNNRALRQGTFVASSLCQWMSGQINQYIPDDGSQIGWISEWQSALGSFVTALIPPAPNLGAYLPLAGGTMVGHIRFQSGVSVILANNTWYYGLDTGGTSRGLILKGGDNNIYVNDGSASYVVIQGGPVANNNFFWNGRDTAGTVRGVVGLLSDNQIHLGDNARAVYFDCGGASAWCSSNIVIPNNYYYYCKATDGSNRAVLGINSGNSLLIGGSAPADTNIYGNPIYMRNNTYALGILQINGFTYLQGGARSYIPGGNDPHQIYADQGYYARHHYTVGGVRDWTCGCLNSGVFAIADESAAAIRFEIDTGGGVSFYNAAYVGGGLTVYNGLYVATGTLTCGLLNCNAGMNVSGSLNVWSGGLYVASGDLTVNANVHVGSGVYAAYLYSSGNVVGAGTVQGGYIHSTYDMRADHDISAGNAIYAGYLYSYGSLQINGAAAVNGGLSVGGDINVGGNLYGNTVQGGYIRSTGNMNVDHDFFAANVQGGYIRSTGNMNVDYDFTAGNQVVANYFYSYGSGQFNNSVSVNNNVFIGNNLNCSQNVSFGQDLDVGWDLRCQASLQCEGLGVVYPGDPTCFRAESGIRSGYVKNVAASPNNFLIATGVCKCPGGVWYAWGTTRTAVKPYERGLAAIRLLRPVSYEHTGHPLAGVVSKYPTMGQRFHGLDLDVDRDGRLLEEIMPEVTPRLAGHPSEELETLFDHQPLTYALINAVKELAERIEALEGKRG